MRHRRLKSCGGSVRKCTAASSGSRTGLQLLTPPRAATANASTNRTYIASNFTPAAPLAHLHLRPLADLVPRPARRPACQDQCRLPIVKSCGGSVRMCTGHVLLFVFGLDAKSGGLGLSRREEPKPDSSGPPDFKYRGSPSSLSLI